MLRLAYAALEAGELYTVAYNAANEEAVTLFMRREIGFTRIAEITERLLARDWSGEASCLDAVFDADKRARKYAAEM
jgi:1-deoxy-D-xylulose-5-phosphate reductoisomerase